MESRYLIIVSNDEYMPIHRKRIMEQIRAITGVDDRLNIRISRRHIEIDIETENIEKTIEKLIRSGYHVLEYSPIPPPQPRRDPSYLCRLLEQERYWEAHEILEDIWRETRDEDLRWLIMLLVSQIKIQMAQDEVAINILRKLLSNPPDKGRIYYGTISTECLINRVENSIYPRNLGECCIKT